ncbi:hypothetical protein GCM10009828_086620 [Actinoplanes couchii]|uniref:Bulb-type lectin domain-containing protein n=2 Tax=Actinoplanes couchii TaxID=403638 RepID=A0ABQ3XEV3_9ACTN|nr:hypothetical protein Aco03nite_054400 [Actinoplanes couchii]
MALATALAAVLSMVGMAAPARAAAADCRNATGPTYGAWSGAQSYTYTRTNNWCMHNPAPGHEHWRLVFQDNGDLVLYDRETVRWRTYTAGTRLVFQNDGNMVVYNANGSVGWAFNTLTSGVGPNTTYRLEWYFNEPGFYFGAFIRQTNPNWPRFNDIKPAGSGPPGPLSRTVPAGIEPVRGNR